MFGLARSAQSARALVETGAEPIAADALDAASVATAILRVRPQAVINELTSLPSHYTPAEMKAAAERDRNVRTEGNANLVARSPMLACSDTCCNLRGSGMPQARAWRMRRRRLPLRRRLGSQPARERMPNWSRRRCTARCECVALRYGFFYGPGTWYASEGDMGEQLRQRQVPVIGAGQGVWSFVHIEDAAAANGGCARVRSGRVQCCGRRPECLNACGCPPLHAPQEHPSRPWSQRRRPWPHSVAIPSTMRRACAARRTRRPNASYTFDRARWSGFTVRIVTT